MNLLKILIIFLILIFPIGELSRIQIFNDISINLNDLIVGLTFVYSIIFIILKKKKIKSRFSKPILIFLSITLLSLLLNIFWLPPYGFIAAFLYFMRFAIYSFIFFIVLQFNPKFKKKLFNLLIISGSIFVFLGLIQYIFYPDLRNLRYLGWDEHYFRLFSTFLDPNFTASFLSMFSVIVIAEIYICKTNFKKKVSLILLFTGIFIAILLTYSRGGYLAFIFFKNYSIPHINI